MKIVPRIQDPAATFEGLEPAPPPESGFAENWRVTLGNMIDEGLSVSEYVGSADVRERNSTLMDMVRNEEIPETLAAPYVGGGPGGSRVDFTELAKIAKEFDPEIKTDEELENDLKGELQIRRDYYNDVTQRAGGAGLAGQAAGGFNAMALDPALWPGFVLGPTGAVAGVTATRAFGQSMLRVGGFAAMEEAAIQAQVMDWKQKIGAPYSYKDALIAIGGAAAVGGVIGGIVGTATNKIANQSVAETVAKVDDIAQGNGLPPKNMAAQNAWSQSQEGEAATTAIMQLRDELANAPDPDMPIGRFADNMDAAEGYVNNPVPYPAKPPEAVFPEAKQAELDKIVDDHLSDYVTVYHGSPHQIEQPDIAKIGTGEGQQSYGHGFYSAESRKVGKGYQQKLFDRDLLNTINDQIAAKADEERSLGALQQTEEIKVQIASIREDIRNLRAEQKSVIGGDSGYLYEIKVPKEDVKTYLDLDEVLDDQPHIMKALEDTEYWKYAEDRLEERADMSGSNPTGAWLLRDLEEDFDPNDVADFLQSIGIKGTRYFDGNSRALDKGTKNLVTFDPSRLKMKASELLDKPEGKLQSKAGSTKADETANTELTSEDVVNSGISVPGVNAKGEAILRPLSSVLAEVEAEEKMLTKLQGCLQGG